MSTRATYQFTSRSKGTHTFYIHHDGYPEGAAEYFFRAIAFNDQAAHSGLPERFFRANPRAEFTRGHDAHGDTEFRYSLEFDENNRLTLFKVEASSISDDTWRTVFSGGPEEFLRFVNKERAKWDESTKEDFAISVNPGHFTTAKNERARLDAKAAENAAYALKFPQYSGNVSHGISELKSSEERLKVAIKAAK
jgi:hypothetical protein